MVFLTKLEIIRPKKTRVSGNASDEKNIHPGGRIFF